jgi:hypothetical protein
VLDAIKGQHGVQDVKQICCEFEPEPFTKSARGWSPIPAGWPGLMGHLSNKLRAAAEPVGLAVPCYLERGNMLTHLEG